MPRVGTRPTTMDVPRRTPPLPVTCATLCATRGPAERAVDLLPLLSEAGLCTRVRG